MRANLFLVLLFAALVAIGCNNAAKMPSAAKNTATASPAAANEHSDPGHDAPRIALADAKKAFDGGTGVIVDVRDRNAYQQEHIKGALHIPLAEIASNMDKLPKGKKIIVYCS